MRALVAEDDLVMCKVLQRTLEEWGYELVVTHEGAGAWEVLQSEDPPPLAILDWLMPGLDGVEICRKARQSEKLNATYIILLTGMNRKEDIIAGLDAGANDYITKPFNREELRARIQVGRRMVEMQSELAARVRELEDAFTHIKTLQGILPICSYCKKIRNDQNYWQKLESYFTSHADVQFSHGVCPECYDKHIQIQLDELGANPKPSLV
jgi:DNA-binding response OmpR family regulator